jgi:hypothetical protein
MVLDPAELDPAELDPVELDPAGLDPAGLDPAGLDPAGLDQMVFVLTVKNSPSIELYQNLETVKREHQCKRLEKCRKRLLPRSSISKREALRRAPLKWTRGHQRPGDRSCLYSAARNDPVVQSHLIDLSIWVSRLLTHPSLLELT